MNNPWALILFVNQKHPRLILLQIQTPELARVLNHLNPPFDLHRKSIGQAQQGHAFSVTGRRRGGVRRKRRPPPRTAPRICLVGFALLRLV